MNGANKPREVTSLYQRDVEFNQTFRRLRTPYRIAVKFLPVFRHISGKRFIVSRPSWQAHPVFHYFQFHINVAVHDTRNIFHNTFLLQYYESYQCSIISLAIILRIRGCSIPPIPQKNWCRENYL